VKEASAVVVGADSILRDGSLINKTGTSSLAVAALEHAKPVYVVCESMSLTPDTMPPRGPELPRPRVGRPLRWRSNPAGLRGHPGQTHYRDRHGTGKIHLRRDQTMLSPGGKLIRQASPPFPMTEAGISAGLDPIQERSDSSTSGTSSRPRILEEVWRRSTASRGSSPGPHPGLCGYHHFQNGNLVGAITLLQREQTRCAIPPRYLGIDAQA